MKSEIFNESENKNITVDLEGQKIIISQMENCICKIKYKSGKEGIGFFCKFPFPDNNNLLNCLFTSNQALNENDIQNNNIIKLIIYNKEENKNIEKEIKIDDSREIYPLKDNDINIIIIEIKPNKDNINNFLEINDEKLESRKPIYAFHYYLDKKLVSYGLINDIEEDKKIFFNFNIKGDSFCIPILSLDNFKVIGILCETNKKKLTNGIYIKFIITIFIKKYKKEESSILKKIGIGAAIAGGVIAGAALLPITLGFGTAGIVGGSIAAGIQAAIGNVAAGSLFAVCTSLGMAGIFASTAAVGAILGAGGLAAYIKGSFDEEKDSKLINATIIEKDKPEIIIAILEIRLPSEREKIREKYNKLFEGRNLDEDINNYMEGNLKIHAENLLKRKDIFMPKLNILKTC